jgi:hypothetical protein
MPNSAQNSMPNNSQSDIFTATLIVNCHSSLLG